MKNRPKVNAAGVGAIITTMRREERGK